MKQIKQWNCPQSILTNESQIRPILPLFHAIFQSRRSSFRLRRCWDAAQHTAGAGSQPCGKETRHYLSIRLWRCKKPLNSLSLLLGSCTDLKVRRVVLISELLLVTNNNVSVVVVTDLSQCYAARFECCNLQLKCNPYMSAEDPRQQSKPISARQPKVSASSSRVRGGRLVVFQPPSNPRWCFFSET